MVQICECGRLMNLNTTWQVGVKTGIRSGRMATRKEFKCPVCGKLRKTDGRGKLLES
jgi:hypothetical protein